MDPLELLERVALHELEDIRKDLDPRPPLLTDYLAKHGDHDQSSHGNWATGGGGSEPSPGDTKAWASNQDGGGVTGTALMEKVLSPETIDRTEHIISVGEQFKDQSTQNVFEHGNMGLPEGQYTPERAALHDELIGKLMDDTADLPTDRVAWILGGLPGSGKSTFLETDEGKALGLDQFASVNPDYFKEALIEAGAVPQFDGLTPMEATGLIHEESSDLAMDAMTELMERGTNLVYDYTMGSEASAMEKIGLLRAAGYEVRTLFVDASPAESLARAEYRYRDMGPDGEGSYSGRFAYFPGIANTPVDANGLTANRQAFEATKDDVDGFILIDHHTLGSPQVVERD